MAYGINQLRKAGRALQDFDDRYSQKIYDMYDGISIQAHKEGRKPSNVESIAEVIGTTFLGGHPSLRRADVAPTDADAGPMKQAAATALSYGIPVANAVPKYVLPTVGVTMAGQALVDLAGQFGQQTSGTLEP